VQLDLSGIVADTQYRSQFEERLKMVIGEVRENSDGLILFIEELHTVVGAVATDQASLSTIRLFSALSEDFSADPEETADDQPSVNSRDLVGCLTSSLIARSTPTRRSL
jgi:hypothetical protein